jgi:hypothetical protein
MPLAQQGASAAQGNLNQASDYWNKLLSGNRAQMQQANAPAINATLSGADAAKRQAGTVGTARGGGVAGENRTADDKTRATIDNALFATRPKAAEEVGKLGTTEMADAINALGVGGNTASTITSVASDSRATSQDINSNAVAQAGQVIGSILGAFAQ